MRSRAGVETCSLMRATLSMLSQVISHLAGAAQLIAEKRTQAFCIYSQKVTYYNCIKKAYIHKLFTNFM